MINTGPSYPNAYGGDLNDESLAVDSAALRQPPWILANEICIDTAAMVLMNYAYAIFSGNGTLVLEYYDLLKQWSDYLIDHTFMPPGLCVSSFLYICGAQFFDSVDGSVRFKPYNVNLALKGIIAIRSMAKISEALQRPDDSSRYEACIIIPYLLSV